MDDDDFHWAEDAAVSFTAGLIIGAIPHDSRQEENSNPPEPENPFRKKAREAILENLDGRAKTVSVELNEEGGLHFFKASIICGSELWVVLSEKIDLRDSALPKIFIEKFTGITNKFAMKLFDGIVKPKQ